MQIDTTDYYQAKHPNPKSIIKGKDKTWDSFKKHALSALASYAHNMNRYETDKSESIKSHVDFSWHQLLFVLDVIKESNDYSLEWEHYMSWRQQLIDAARAYLKNKESLDGNHLVLFNQFKDWVNVSNFDQYFSYL